MPARKNSFDRNKYLQTETLEGNFICLFMFHEEIERNIVRNINNIITNIRNISNIATNIRNYSRNHSTRHHSV